MELEDGIYEECPDCHGKGADEERALDGRRIVYPCVRCNVTGLVPHECPDDGAVAA